jgi:beta-galactosidase beta subunit
MLWSSLEDCQSVLKEYDEGRDVEIYSDKPSARFSVPRGYFAVFFPTDAHASGVASSTFRKIIVKAKVE